MVPAVLASLGRDHNPDNVYSAAEQIRSAGISNVNFDLIYGAMEESLENWRTSLDLALSLGPQHLSGRMR